MWTCITEYYFEGPGYEILTLRQCLNQIIQHAPERMPDTGNTKSGAYGKLGLGHIWNALGKPEGISMDGALVHRIQPGTAIFYGMGNGPWLCRSGKGISGTFGMPCFRNGHLIAVITI